MCLTSLLPEDLKAEAAKLLAEAEAVEHKAVEFLTGDAEKAEGDVLKESATAVEAVVADAKAEVTADSVAVETKAVVVAAAVRIPLASVKGKKICGVQYAEDGMTIEWKG